MHVFFLLDAEIDEIGLREHPDIVKAVQEATAIIDASSVSISQEMYIEALKNGISMAEEKKKEKNPTGPK